MRRWTKALLGLLVVGILVVGGVVGGVVNHALAQPGSGTEDASAPQEQFLSSVAAKLGVSADQLKGAIQSTELEMLDNAVEQGKVRPEVADRLRQRIEEGRLLPSLSRAASGQERLRPGQRLVLHSAAEVLDMTPADLVRELRDSGKSLAQLAEEKGISRDELKSGILADVEKHLDNGLERLRENIDRIIDRTPGEAAASSTQ
jgi:lambda repressor-like predicted transcriptional regulator